MLKSLYVLAILLCLRKALPPLPSLNSCYYLRNICLAIFFLLLKLRNWISTLTIGYKKYPVNVGSHCMHYFDLYCINFVVNSQYKVICCKQLMCRASHGKCRYNLKHRLRQLLTAPFPCQALHCLPCQTTSVSNQLRCTACFSS